MAEQKGINKFSGSLGDTVGYSRGNKFFKRKKTSPYTPPAESLKSASEFGLASKASALYRKAFYNSTLRSFKPNLHVRLTKVFADTIRSGPAALKGKRNIIDGDLKILKNFEFNQHKSLESLSSIKMSYEINNSNLRINLLPFKNTKHPKNINYKSTINISFGWFNFNESAYTILNSNSIILNDDENFKSAQLDLMIPKEDNLTFIVMGCVFYETLNDYNSKYTITEDRRWQAGKILEALNFKNGELFTPSTEVNHNKKTETKEIKFDVFWK